MKTNTGNNLSEWSYDKARYTFGIGNKASEFEYLDISENGDLLLNLSNGQISIPEITKKVKEYGLSSFVLRIPELIKFQLDKLYGAFQKAITKHNYLNVYQGVFPVKVNQTYTAIKSVYEYGRYYNHGFEVGTKPELLLAVSQVSSHENTPIISNGTKDRDYLEACIVIQKAGYNLIISIESIQELDLLIELAEEYNTIPSIGLRIKLLQEVTGHWGQSSGFYSKFGISGHKLKEIITKIDHHGMKSAVKLIHGHIGSQINNKVYFSNATSELVGIYVGLRNKGFDDLRYLNLGGGLGIDYTGNRENDDSGTSYTFEEYADTIIKHIKELLAKHPEIPEPIIMTESGRAVSAHYSFLVVEIIEKRDFLDNNQPNLSELFKNSDLNSLWDEVTISLEKINTFHGLSRLIYDVERKLNNIINNSAFWQNYEAREELETHKILFNDFIRQKFKSLTLTNKENTCLSTKMISEFENVLKYLITPTTHLLGNFSVFNGACDAVLVDQYFPVIPTQHLDEKPFTLIKAVDITCDSDGELSKFISPNRKGNFEKWTKNDFFTSDNHLFRFNDGSSRLNGIPFPKSNLNPGKFFIVGLTGAYQSTVYFDQNLLGRVPEIALTFNEESKEYKLSLLKQVEMSIDLLPKMNHDPSKILRRLPQNPIFESLLYSSPYINHEIREEKIIELFNEQNQSILFPVVKEELLVNVLSENSSFEE
ncbi:MAG: biosynthetic arginine decarboxylase [Candidatus Hodarchaeales archaeon]|jgi:arginine decarboxylase